MTYWWLWESSEVCCRCCVYNRVFSSEILYSQNGDPSIPTTTHPTTLRPDMYCQISSRRLVPVYIPTGGVWEALSLHLCQAWVLELKGKFSVWYKNWFSFFQFPFFDCHQGGTLFCSLLAFCNSCCICCTCHFSHSSSFFPYSLIRNLFSIYSLMYKSKILFLYCLLIWFVFWVKRLLLFCGQMYPVSSFVDCASLYNA